MILQQFRLDGKVAVVTGCGTGLGEGMAIGLAEAGADIVGVYNTHAPEKANPVDCQWDGSAWVEAGLTLNASLSKSSTTI